MKTEASDLETSRRSSPWSRAPAHNIPIPNGRSPAIKKLDDSAERIATECGTPPEPPAPRAYVDGCESPPLATTSVKILAALAILTIVVVAQSILLPITVAVLLALTLRPLLRRCRRLGLPDALSAAAVLFAIVVVCLAGLTSVVEPARHWMESAPNQIQKIEDKFADLRQPWAALSKTSAKVKELAEAATGSNALPVEMHESQLTRHLTIATSTGNVLGTCLVVLVLCFFVLTSGDQLLSQILAGLPRLSEKKRTVELIREVERGIATYLSTVTLINAGLGVATAAGFWLMGVPNPALWGAMAFAFNYVPFFGPAVCTVVMVFVSLLSFDSLAYAMLPPAYFIAISAVEGNVLTPTIIGRSMSLNPIIVFIALIVGGWAWGLGGAILAVPLLTVTKIASDKFESTQGLARLLTG